MIKEVNFKDRESVNLSDSFGDRKKDGRGPIGRVKIFERRVEGTDKVLYLVGQSPNLIVYHGRNWLMQRAFAQDLSGFTNWNTYKLGWFAIGTGAAVANPLSPTAPALSNIALATHGVIGSGTNYVTVLGKQYHVVDSVTYEEDDEVTTYASGTSDNYLVAKVTTTLTTNEANNDSGSSGYSGYEYYQDINEAGLFFSDYKTISPAPSVMQMFARVTFPTIRKTNTTELVFNWYIYF